MKASGGWNLMICVKSNKLPQRDIKGQNRILLRQILSFLELDKKERLKGVF